MCPDCGSHPCECVRFRDLGIGETFAFASVAGGPWVKIDSRQYRHHEWPVVVTVADEKARVGRVSKQNPPRPIAEMTAGQLNSELDRLDQDSSGITDEMIAAGRGYETPSETLKLDDPLALRMRTNFERRSAVRREMELRYGPGVPRRLPPGRSFGPRKNPAENPLHAQDYLVARSVSGGLDDTYAVQLSQDEGTAWERMFDEAGWADGTPLEYAIVKATDAGAARLARGDWKPLRAKPRASMAPMENSGRKGVYYADDPRDLGGNGFESEDKDEVKRWARARAEESGETVIVWYSWGSGAKTYTAIHPRKKNSGRPHAPKKGKTWNISLNDTVLHTWFERDRQHVELRDKSDVNTIIEWWDEDVTQAIEDGFLNPRDWKKSAYEYAVSVGLIKSPGKNNPAGLTPKGERTYEHILKSYPAEHPRRKEIASRTVRSMAFEGTPGLIKPKGNPHDRSRPPGWKNKPGEFPAVSSVAAVLEDLYNEFKNSIDDEEGLEVRLQVLPEGRWAVHYGDPGYDTDHHGFWGASWLVAGGGNNDFRAIAEDLIEQVSEQAYEESQS